MTLTLIITIILAIAGMTVTVIIAFKQGVFKKIRLEFSPSKVVNAINDGLIDFKPGRKPRIPAVAILRFFEWRKRGFYAISSHIYLTLENRSKYAIRNLSLTLSYPRQYFDETDKQFFQFETVGTEEDSASYTVINGTTIQINYKLKELHPFALRSLMHPIFLPIADFTQALEVDDPFLSAINEKSFSYFRVDVTLSARNLPKPIYSNFWVVNVLNQTYPGFMEKEKLFIYELTRLFRFPKHLLEIQQIKEYNQGKYQKDVLVAKPEYANISYSHFPPIKSPYDGRWNFENSK